MSKLQKKSVPDWLNEVDYGEMEKYIPSEFAVKFINFIKLINNGAEENESPPVHFKMLDGFASRHSHVANLCSRGLGKTTLMCEYLVLFLAVFRHIPNFGSVDGMIYVSDSMENGVKNFRKNVQTRYEKSDILPQLLPKVHFTDAYIEFENSNGEKFGVKMYGSKTSMRGTKIFGKRPNLAVLDDLVSDEDANSPTNLDKIKDTIYKAVDYALHPTRKKIVFNGTPFNKNDPLYEAVESGGWFVSVYPICDSFPVDEKDFRGAWEDRFPYSYIKQQYDMAVATGKVKAFNQELMLRISSEEDRVIHDSDLRWFNSKELLKNKQQYNFVITTDFATSTQRRADYTVIGVWALDVNQNRYLVDGVIGRQLMNQTFDDLFRLVQKYNPLSVGIEISGQQGAFISLIREEMIKRDVYFNIASAKGRNQVGIPAQTNKMNRLRLSVPFFKNNKFYLPEDLKHTILIIELLDELAYVTIDGIKSKHDDALDMLSQLDQMFLIYPDEYQSKLKRQDTVEVNLNDRSFFTDNLSDSFKHDGYLV